MGANFKLTNLENSHNQAKKEERMVCWLLIHWYAPTEDAFTRLFRKQELRGIDVPDFRTLSRIIRGVEVQDAGCGVFDQADKRIEFNVPILAELRKGYAPADEMRVMQVIIEPPRE
jgi:hypothetical protein